MTGQFTVELKYHDGVSEKTFRAATGKGYKTLPTDTPARAVFEPRLIDTGSIQTFLFNNASTSGFSTLGAGRIKLNNADGEVGALLLNQGTDGRDVIIRENDGSGQSFPTNFKTRFSGVSSTLVEINSTTALVSVISTTGKFFNLPLQPVKYSGLNDGSTVFFEGTANDIGGSPKPLLYGSAKNFSVPLADIALDAYQVSSEPVFSIDTVYVGRSIITTGVLHATLAALRGATVVGGTYDYYLGDSNGTGNDRGCYFRLGSSATSFRVTADATEGWENQALRSEEFDNATWTKTNITVGADSTIAPDNNLTADTLTATSANGTCLQTVTTGSSEFTHGVWLKRKTGIGNIDITVDGGTTYETKTLSLTAWVFFETAAQTVSNPQFGIRIVSNGDEVYVWGAMLCQHPECGPYTATTTTARLNNHIPALVWKVMRQQGFLLDLISVAEAQADFSGLAQHWQGLKEEIVGRVIDLLAASGYFFWTDTADGRFIIGQFKVPLSSESVLAVDDRTLLGREKVKRLTSNDQNKGVPIKRANVGYEQNYTILTASEVAGVALSDIAFTSEEFRVVNDATSAEIQFITASDWNLDTKLQLEADADTIAALITSLHGEAREIIEIKLPLDFSIIKATGELLEENDVITVQNKVYRVIGKLSRFPKVAAQGAQQITNQAFVFQAWGGVSV